MLSLSPNRTNTIVKTETWTDSTTVPPYILILSGDTEGNFIIYDPKENNKIVFASSDYEEARLWLLEDEYERVRDS
ncbi:MAG: hypothetical protein KA717_06875 [Woronichinia naegeliana WA131]|jgi:hypothetical protein|uniref:Uncharacterized protein n=1 Tax=Woronichinia naegeliana WA131 TaxID=2824559 RepID=A0A977PX71_9CYAN|nr:MAG: hypothetical protein KA717_06875 [Woronichinia naegeliana WA131]